jgi:leucine dehydrogenase
MVFEKIELNDSANSQGFEQVVYCNDARVGLKAIISLHSTVLGPAVGGCRMWAYQNEGEALNDVLRLSKGMTYKAAISGLEWGGGKAVIIGDPKAAKSTALLARFGEMVDRLGGAYVTAKDVGIGSDDLRIVKSRTRHVLGIDGEAGSSGDPSPATAWGVYHGMKAAARQAFGSDSLSGLTVALQGLGSVSYALLGHLSAEGAKVVGTDIEQAVIDRALGKYGAAGCLEIVHPDAIYDVKCDIFSPSALGASINPQSLPRIRAKVVAGAANNQLSNPEMGEELVKRRMVYAPDYAINAGGLMNIYHEAEAQGGYSRERAFDHISMIGQTIAQILTRAEAESLPTSVVADRMAEERVNAGRNRSRQPQLRNQLSNGKNGFAEPVQTA